MTSLGSELRAGGVPASERRADLRAVERLLSWFADTVGGATVSQEIVRDDEDVYLRAVAPVDLGRTDLAGAEIASDLCRGSLDVHLDDDELVLVVQLPLSA